MTGRPKRLELTVEQIDILTDALYGKPPRIDIAHSVQSVLWAARWDEECSNCNGTGRVELGPEVHDCPVCESTGEPKL